MDMSGLFCAVISHRETLAKEVQKGLLPVESFWIPGLHVPSFSYLVNQAISMAYHADRSTVIVCSDKVRPTAESVSKILGKLDEGYGWVGLYRFAFFGFRIELIQRLGPLEERLKGGGLEDSDYMFRLKEADVAIFEDENESVNYRYEPTTWRKSSDKFFSTKWRWDNASFVERLLPEQPYSYPFMDKEHHLNNQVSYLPWSRSVLLPPSKWLLSAKIGSH